MTHLVLAAVLATGFAPVRPRGTGVLVYEVNLRPERRDYQLISPPGFESCLIQLKGAHRARKSKLVFTTPFRAQGGRSLTFEPEDRGRDQTYTVSVPVAPGQTVFVVTALGQARYDFSFQVTGGKEYRFTFTGPLLSRELQIRP